MLKRYSICILICLALGACTDDKPERGLQYMPDMLQSPALKSQEAYEITAEDEHGSYTIEVPGMRLAPEGTVPRHYIPFDINDSEQGKGLQNPIAATRDVLIRGRDQYNTFCAVCHGKDGDAANGYVAKQFLGIPSVNNATVNDSKTGYNDGHLFWIISAGRGRMPDYRAQLKPADRWAVIHYLRALYRATESSKDDRIKKLLDDKGEGFEPLVEPVPEYDLKNWPPEVEL